MATSRSLLSLALIATASLAFSSWNKEQGLNEELSVVKKSESATTAYSAQDLSRAAASLIDATVDGVKADLNEIEGFVKSQVATQDLEILESASRAISSTNLRSLDGEVPASIIPATVLTEIKQVLFDEDESKYGEIVARYYDSDSFSQLTFLEKANVQISLEALGTLRYDVARILWRDHSELRRSPGDRMIFSEAVSRMSPCQRASAADVAVIGLGLPFGGAIGIPFAIYGLARAAYGYFSDC